MKRPAPFRRGPAQPLRQLTAKLKNKAQASFAQVNSGNLGIMDIMEICR